MNAPLPGWTPFAPSPATVEPLHLRFAIPSIGPSLPPLPAGAAADIGRPAAHAWHELTLSALLVCLAVDEAGLTAGTPATALPAVPLPPLAAPEAPEALRGLAVPEMPPLPMGLGLDEEWMKLPSAWPGPDTAWLLA